MSLKPAAGKSSRILVIRGGAVGDFILTLPALELLRENLPSPRIEVLGYPGIAELAQYGGFADGIRSIESAALAGFFVPGGRLDRDLQVFFSGFDLVFSLLYDPDRFFAENLKRCGVRTLIEGSHRVDDSAGIPAAKQLAKPLEELALYLERPFVWLSEPESEPEPLPVIAIHPGSGSPLKNWGFERWIHVLRELHQHRTCDRFLLISGEAESETIPAFTALLQKHAIPFDHAASQPLPELAQRLAACQGFLGHDSGISHLAAATGIPCLLLFGPTDPGVWAPQNPGVTTLRALNHQLAALSPAEVASRARDRFAP